MLLERAEILVKESEGAEFAAAVDERGKAILFSVEGVHSVTFGRGVEVPNKFLLLIEWASMDAHVAFTKAPIFTEFLSLMSRYSQGGSMEHFNMG